MDDEAKRCGAEWPRPMGAVLIGRHGILTNGVPAITCEREQGHDGEHEAVTLDADYPGLQYRSTWSTNAER